MEHQQSRKTNDACHLPALCALLFASLLIYCVSLSQSSLSLPVILPLHLFMEGKEINRATKHELFDLGLCNCVVERVTAI